RHACAWGAQEGARGRGVCMKRLLLLAAVVSTALLSTSLAQAQCSGGAGQQTGLGSQSCTGIAAWTGQAVASGASVTYNNCVYRANQNVPANPSWCPG